MGLFVIRYFLSRLDNIMKQKKILIVDDEIDICSILGDYLKDCFEVETACDGEEALSKANWFAPDCVILDILMPGMSGVQAMRLLREKYPQVRIIVLTASGSDAMLKQCQTEGVNGYLLKPVDLDVLTALIEGALSEK